MRLTISDIEDVERILGHESVFYYAKDDADFNATDASVSVLRDPRFTVLRPSDDTLFLFVKQNHILTEMHVCIIDGNARKKGVDSAIKAVRWLLSNSNTQKVITYIPANNESALTFAYMCGMKQEGCIKSGYLKDGKLQDLILLGSARNELIKLHGE